MNYSAAWRFYLPAKYFGGIMISQRLKNLHPYVPGEQPKDREYIKLNANENPYPPHRSVGEAIQKAVSGGDLNVIARYPDPDVTELRQAIAAMLNQTGGVLGHSDVNGLECKPSKADEIPFEVTPDMIFCGNGSDEVLSFVFYACFDSNRPLVLPEFTYSFYPVYCGYYNIPMNTIALKDDWTLDVEKMLSEADKTQSSLIFANPNAPTGLALSRAQVRDILLRAPKDRVVVVDEAYCDFGGESCIPLLKEFDNLLIVRTFSKSLSFAGMRLGYVVANPELVKYIFMVKNSFNHFPVDFMAKTAAVASCKAAGYYADNAKKIMAERESLTEFLRERKWFVIDSTTNFVFAKKDGIKGHDIYEAVKKEGILIRHFATKGIEDFVRISIGTHEQMEQLKEVLGGI